jgi:hypothetical protein
VSHYIIFSDGTFDYHIDDEGILVVTTDELDEFANRNQVQTIGPDEMEAFIEWLTTEFRKRKNG